MIINIINLNAVEREIYRDSTGKTARYAGRFNSKVVRVPVNYNYKRDDFRGVWVATINNINFPKTQNRAEFIKEYRKIINDLVKINANVIVFQIRPNNDAFYHSKLNNLSPFLYKETDKKFDPLKFMIEEAHKNNIEFHAWLNPYRVVYNTSKSKKEYLKSLPKDNFARKNMDLVLEVKQPSKRNNLLLNPGEPKVREFIVKTVAEVVDNYNVDAIHFDDYFYPYDGFTNQDEKSYKKYSKHNVSVKEWRRTSVTTLITSIKDVLDKYNSKYKKSVQFGISPFGIWANKKSDKRGSLSAGKESYNNLYADIYSWIKNDYIDYVVPQIYWNFNHEIAPYAALTDWWSNTVKNSKCKLYIGLNAGNIGVRYDEKEFSAMLRYNSVINNIQGNCIFSYSSIFKPDNAKMRKGVYDVLVKYWNANK